MISFSKCPFCNSNFDSLEYKQCYCSARFWQIKLLYGFNIGKYFVLNDPSVGTTIISKYESHSALAFKIRLDHMINWDFSSTENMIEQINNLIVFA